VPEELEESIVGNMLPASSDQSRFFQLAAAVPGSVLRLAYAFEFLLALVAAVVLWTQVGGQGHLDLIPWYLKLLCILVLPYCVVRFTVALGSAPPAWNRQSRLWFTGVLLAGVLMGGITFWYHLHEVSDDSDSEQTSATSVSNFPLGKMVSVG
jgi:hypothetical protein